ncbi:hypothetical protein IV203_008310 [Nitzschia inconspicua]|uniref:Uncharacterized protein n=1 Tax=Nitzschia inconspicua TaxID=303405 RepID=A0A9K3KYM8_9STRA|nr:hypothetical protein IV203_008310 [Nitzschia inconspicua]
MKQSSTNGTLPSEREALLQNFALSATTRPLNREVIDRSRCELLDKLGPEVLVEAAGVVGLFECFTKFVDATGRKANSDKIQNIMAFVLSAQTWIYSVVSWVYRQ